MKRIIDVPALDGIDVHVLQFLKHHPGSPDLFWLASFLPYLIFTLGFVRELVGMQLAEKHLGLVAFEQVDDLASGVHLETFHHVGELGGGGYQMHVILENDVTVQAELFVRL